MSQSLDRALTLLGGLAKDARTLDQLAEEVGVHKSTVLRLLRTLEAHHFVHRVGARHYRLGSALFDLANQALEQRDVRRSAEPALADLNERTGHTVHLASYEDGEVVYIDKFEGRHSVRMYSRVGKRAPLHCTAVGKVLVAAFPPARRAEIAAGIDYVRMTGNTIGTVEDYLAELARVAERGYAVDNAEHEDFIHCVAAPIRGAGGEVLAAVSLSVPKVLLDFEGLLALVPDLVAAAEEASLQSGWTPSVRRTPEREDGR
ncbi:DNA-binding transcriptional regulator, IclR family [Amycolatopsis arida]|uniref:DNA-binding transcriptional regulator, IclR family n=1 Tax=Amycolatopsis arida TaxID=587909 RepID=A0A1I6AGQ7_9PSEU|nr:IclR family transcriptional regulator [Amycolatopsis arida]TDX97732.1 DNA-binding IclR family transcriptional regulator [Amycolatopsis arida]SFQ67904.1 DNA-binding transcriptional regulator, IclR family [Amycolatopsis arida]